jgi:hypothetical protein
MAVCNQRAKQSAQSGLTAIRLVLVSPQRSKQLITKISSQRQEALIRTCAASIFTYFQTHRGTCSTAVLGRCRGCWEVQSLELLLIAAYIAERT